MNVDGDLNLFLRNIIDIVAKGNELNRGAVINGILYIIVNNSFIYSIDVSEYTNVLLGFNAYDYHDTNGEYIKHSYYDMTYVENVINRLNTSRLELLYDNDNCREIEAFESIITSKSSEGSTRLYLDTSIGRTMMLLYKPLFGMSKPDKCSLQIFNNSIPNTKIAKFTIYKAKLKMYINLEFMYIEMIRS